MWYSRGDRTAPVSTATKRSCATAPAPASSQPTTTARVKVTMLRARWLTAASDLFRGALEDVEGGADRHRDTRTATALRCAGDATARGLFAEQETSHQLSSRLVRGGILQVMTRGLRPFHCPTPRCNPLAGRTVFVSATMPVPGQWHALPPCRTGCWVDPESSATSCVVGQRRTVPRLGCLVSL